MHTAPVLLLILAAAAAAGAAGAATPAPDAQLAADLRRIAGSRVYFGHKSVGYNIVDGLAELSASAGVPLAIAEVSDSLAGAPAGGFLHGPVAENGNPARKLESFARALDSATGDVDVAALKFCYVDFGPGTDVAALFARYQATLAALQARHPHTTFVHFTVPLTIVQGGAKAFLKRLLGRTPYGAAENVRREEYNALVRAAYAREPLVDIARVESTAADGRPYAAEWEGRRVPALVPAYTEDGGHLNRAGRLRVARELVSVLARAPRAGAAGTGRD
jgi:hypothetical protein